MRSCNPPPTLKVLAKPPAKHDGNEKDLQFKTWAASAELHFTVKKQSPEAFIDSAVSWLAGAPQHQAMLLLQDKPAESWTLSA